MNWEQRALYHFCTVAFSDGKPDSTPDQVRGRLFPENAPADFTLNVVTGPLLLPRRIAVARADLALARRPEVAAAVAGSQHRAHGEETQQLERPGAPVVRGHQDGLAGPAGPCLN